MRRIVEILDLFSNPYTPSSIHRVIFSNHKNLSAFRNGTSHRRDDFSSAKFKQHRIQRVFKALGRSIGNFSRDFNPRGKRVWLTTRRRPMRAGPHKGASSRGNLSRRDDVSREKRRRKKIETRRGARRTQQSGE